MLNFRNNYMHMYEFQLFWIAKASNVCRSMNNTETLVSQSLSRLFEAQVVIIRNFVAGSFRLRNKFLFESSRKLIKLNKRTNLQIGLSNSMSHKAKGILKSTEGWRRSKSNTYCLSISQSGVVYLSHHSDISGQQASTSTNFQNVPKLSKRELFLNSAAENPEVTLRNTTQSFKTTPFPGSSLDIKVKELISALGALVLYIQRSTVK